MRTAHRYVKEGKSPRMSIGCLCSPPVWGDEYQNPSKKNLCQVLFHKINYAMNKQSPSLPLGQTAVPSHYSGGNRCVRQAERRGTWSGRGAGQAGRAQQTLARPLSSSVPSVPMGSSAGRGLFLHCVGGFSPKRTQSSIAIPGMTVTYTEINH